MPNDLTGSTPAATRAKLLHLGEGTLAAKSPVRLGDGTPSKLGLSASGVLVGDVELIPMGSTARQQKLQDAAGVLHPRLRARLTGSTNAANSTVTPADVGLTWEDASALLQGTYEIRAVIICQSAATTTGVRLRLDGPTGETSLFVGQWSTEGGAATRVSAWATGFEPTTAPVAATPFLQTFTGFVTLSADALSVPSLMLYSEVAASNVEVLPGSFVEFTRIL